MFLSTSAAGFDMCEQYCDWNRLHEISIKTRLCGALLMLFLAGSRASFRLLGEFVSSL